jgi:hypothetical protein
MKKNALVILNLISFFLIILIGKKLGGIMAFYFLLGLFFLQLHSFVMLAGLIMLIISTQKKRDYLVYAGSICLYAGLVLFFTADTDRETYGSFTEPISVISFCVFVILNIWLLGKTLLHKETSSI